MDCFQQQRPLEMLELELAAWEQAAVSLLDIRRQRLGPGESILNYTSPANMFLYVCGNKGLVELDDSPYRMERFGLFHGGRGMRCSVSPDRRHEWLDCYMVLYKAGKPLIGRGGLSRLPDQVNPFSRQYGFCPDNPLFFEKQMRRMHERWSMPSPLRRLSVKASFYQLVSEVYEELASGRGQLLKPDAAVLARRYIDEHYHEVVSVQELEEALRISSSHLRRIFKQQTGESPQEYLIGRRLAAAQQCLRDSQGSLREVALACGFPDEFSLMRTFRNRLGMTPSEFRAKIQVSAEDHAIGWPGLAPYTDERIVGQFKLQDKGDYAMRHKTKASMMLTAMLGLTLLLSACGGGATSTDAGASAQPSPAQSATVQPSGLPEAATRIIHTELGDVEVPANPQRVACYTWTGDLLSIGVVPVASDLVNNGSVKNLLSESSYWHPRITSSEETLMAANPDLIIVRSEEEYNTFGKIAPTIVVPYETSIEDRMKLFGEVFNKEEEAQEAVDAFYAKVEQYKEDFKSAGIYGKSIALMRPTEDGVFVYGDDWGFGAQLLYTMLDFKIPDTVQTEIIDTGEGVRQVSWEVAATYLEADYIEMIFLSEDKEAERTYIKENKVWNTIDAVKNEKLIEFSVNMYDSKSLYVLDKLLDYYHEQFLNHAK